MFLLKARNNINRICVFWRDKSTRGISSKTKSSLTWYLSSRAST